MITVERLCNSLSEKHTFSDRVQDENLANAAEQIFAAIISDRDIYFYNTEEAGSYLPIGCTADQVKNRLLSSRSTLHFRTSGTTGEPKYISHAVQDLLQGVRPCRVVGQVVWGFCYSCRHISGVLVLLQAWMTDASIVDLRNLGKVALSEMLEFSQVTHISAPTTFYRMNLPLAKPRTSVVSVTNGGEPLDKSTIESITVSFPNAVVRNVYASTEFGSLLVAKGSAFTIPSRLTDKIKIKSGTIHVNRSRVANNVTFDGEWYDTRDRVEWLDDNVFKIVGRVSEQVKVLGHLVSLRSVEAAINHLSGVKVCRVQAIPHTVFGSLLSAEVVLEDECKWSKKEVKTSLADSLRDYEVPPRIKIIDQIKTTYTGKVARASSAPLGDG